MTPFLLIFITELFILFLLSRKVHQRVGQLLLRITQNQKRSKYLLAVLFLPGTFVHELAHLLTALLLLVPVGQPEFMPEFTEDNKIKLGSVPVVKTDPARSFLVSVAPLIFGIGVIVLGLHFFIQMGLLSKPLYILAATYLVFTISNTMFASKKDLEGAWKFIVIVIVAMLAGYLLGVRFDLTTPLETTLVQNLKTATIFLAPAVIIDIAVLLLPS